MLPKQLIYRLLSGAILLLSLTSCVKTEDFNNAVKKLQEEINQIKDVNIASIDKQITSINSTLTSL